MLKKIPVESLRLGMRINELCGSWMEHPFWRSKFTLKDEADIRRIRESGITEVWIDTSKGLDVAVDEVPVKVEAQVAVEVDQRLSRSEPPTQKQKKVEMGEEVERASKICSQGKAAVISMFNEARMGQALSTEATGALVNEISSSVSRNPGALISLARLKTVDDYTYLHSVAVCALMVALARKLDMDDASTHELGLAGLLHDMGKALMPADVLNKPGKLTDEEFAIIKGHPKAGHKLLTEGGAVGEIPLGVVLHHHEKMDGSGYPGRLKGDEISLYSRMGAVCDVYDAITSDRPYKKGWNPAEAVRKMAEWCNGHFDEKVFRAFVECIGIYPIGSLVRLSSGNLAVVIEQSDGSPLKPCVKAFFSTKSKTYIEPEIIDLSSSSARDRIAGREDASIWGLKDIDRLWIP